MKAVVLFLSLFLLTNGFSQPQRQFVNWNETDTSVRIEVSDGVYEISAYSSNNLEVWFFPSRELNQKASHAVIAKRMSKPFCIRENKKQLILNTSAMRLEVDKLNFQLRFYRGKELLFSESKGHYIHDNMHHLGFTIGSEEELFGGGARALGMNRRGNRLELYNKAHYGYEERSELMNYTMPTVLSSKKYLLHFDNAPIGFLDLDSQKDNTLTYETIGGRYCYQVTTGDSWEKILEHFTAMTGRQPLPPRWVFGNFASRFGYHSESETRAVVEKFREEDIPLDAVVLDLYWFGREIQGTLGNLEFYRDSFPTGERMIQDFANLGIKTVLITEPFILTTSKRWKEAVKEGILCKDSLGNPFTYDFYFGNTGLIDIYGEQGKSWLWNVYANMHRMGVGGFWGDLGEPEVHPKGLLHATGSADELHNRYGHDWAGLIHNGFRMEFPENRPFILMRSGFSGSQRYGIIPWSGDVNRTWGGLKSQMEIALQMGLQGIGYMHSDLGGFAGAKDDSELYIRWLQYGVFQPVFRPHAQEQVASEPIFKDEKTKQLARTAIQLRYAMLPYNYTLAYLNSTKGIPLMRPLLFENADIPNSSTSHSYFWGHDFLVTPVVDSAAQRVSVRIPPKSVWYDFHRGTRIENSNDFAMDIAVNVSLDHIPVMVRAGAIIPMTNGLKNTEQYQSDSLEIHVYLDSEVKKSQGLLYEDNGRNANALSIGDYSLTQFELIGTKKGIVLRGNVRGKISDQKRKMRVVYHNCLQKPSLVALNTSELSFFYDENLKTLIIDILQENSNFELLVK
jgi:oligosaccharide 4-alpha-D-glucosyltransferase